MPASLSWILAGLLALPGIAAGQDLREVTRGDRIRITVAADQRVVGSFVGADSAYVVLDVRGADHQQYRRTAIQKLERSGGSYREGDIWKGVGVGALIGATLGLGAAELGNSMAEFGQGGVNTAGAIAIGAGVGAIAGAIIGSGSRKERWIPVALSSAQADMRSTVFGIHVRLGSIPLR